MELFPELKCLYMEGNSIEKIQGLTTNVMLMSLMLHENAILKMEGLDFLTKLRTMNLSDNCIVTIEGLKNCVVLDSLYIKQNRIGKNGISDLIGLLECPTISCLEISNNCISDPECIEEIFVKMASLKVLYL